MDLHPPLRFARFDLILACFVLHWVDRRRLLASLASLDTHLADGGCLVITDFFAPQPSSRPYHHLPGKGINTYKADYPAMLVATGLYRLVQHEVRRYPDSGKILFGGIEERLQGAVLERLSKRSLSARPPRSQVKNAEQV
jgi:hypothetical protein